MRKSGVTQKGVIQARIEEVARQISSDGRHLFSLRQLFYGIRPFLLEAFKKEPSYGTFSRVIGHYEDRHGDIPNLYRDDRGSVYQPHGAPSLPLGTRAVSGYKRPEFMFNKVLFVEKEGFYPLLKEERWPERHDCALVTSKGFSSRAGRQFLKRLKQSKERITVFCLHDADGSGTVIYESLKRKLEPDVDVINLGLDPAEARAMGLPVEQLDVKKHGKVTVADYIPAEDKEWLQSNRVELNAMSSEQFIRWLDGKMLQYDKKVVPPAKRILKTLEEQTRDAVRANITEAILKEANLGQQVDDAMDAIAEQIRATAATLKAEMPTKLSENPDQHWSEVVKAKAKGFADQV